MSLERILVCAEPSTAERFADALRARGYDAETASDRAAALTLTETTHPAIVLTWSNLPETEIVGFVQRLGELSPRPRVAVVVRDEDMERCGDLLEVGVDALLLDDPEMAFLLSSLHRLRGGGLVVDPSLARALVARADAGSRASELGSVSEVEDPPGGPGDAATEVRVVEFQECDLAEVVRTSVAEAALAFPLITVEVHTPPALPAVGEPGALQGVVRILVDNACRRTSSGSSVTVKAKKAVEGLTVSVTTRGSGGNGEEVGLDLARSLVALHGGILWSEPLPAGGTRLLFTLPPKPPALADEEREAAIQALELLAGIGAQPEAASLVEEAETEEPEERVGDLEVLDAAPDEVDPILDLTDIRDRTAADEMIAPTPESLQSVPEVEPDSSVSAETEVGPDEFEPDVVPDLASQEVDLDLPLEPVDHPSPVEVGAAGLEPEPPEQPAGIAPDAEEAPPAEVETVAGESKLRRKWKHRRPRWKRMGQAPTEQTTDEPSELEPAAGEHQALSEVETPPAGEALEVEPDPTPLVELQAEADDIDLDLVPDAADEESVPEPASAEEPADRPGPADVEVEEAADVSVPFDEESRLPSEDEAPSSGDLLEPEPEPSVLAEEEAADDETEEEYLPLEAPQLETDVDLPSAEEPEEPPAQPPVEVEVTAEVPAGPEEQLEGATEAETPTEAEAAPEAPSLRRKRKHRRMRWGRAPQVPRSEEVEPSEEQPEDAPPEVKAPPTGDVLEVEVEPAALADPQADVDAAEPDRVMEVPAEEVSVEEMPPEEVLVSEAPPEEAPIEEVPTEDLPDLQPQAPPDHHPSELQVEVEAAAEEPGTSEDETDGPPDYEEPETPTIEIPDPQPVANAKAAVAQEKGSAPELPPRPFVPDPFDPATQMLRSLALDYDDDDAPPDPFRAQRGR